MANAGRTPCSSEKPRKRRAKYESVEEELVENDENVFYGHLKTPPKKKVRQSRAALERTMPDILDTSQEFGSPHKFWTSLCERDESYVRDFEYFTKFSLLKPEMRVILVEWVMNVCEDLKLHRETFHLALDFIDRFLTKSGTNPQKQTVQPDNLQLIAVSSLLLATKIEEIYPPKLFHLIDLTDGACSDEHARRMEEVILTALEWHCSPVTAVQWLAFYLQLISKQEIDHKPTDVSLILDSQSRSRFPVVMPASSPLTAITAQDSLPSIRSQDSSSSKLVDANTSADTSFIASNHSQMRHLQSFSVPKIMRDDFIVLTKILDFCAFDMQFLRFTYSEVAAAVVMSFYEPKYLVEKITGFQYSSLKEALTFVEPVINVIRAEVQPGLAFPRHEGVDSRDQHNIQVSYSDAKKIRDQITKQRKERKECREEIQRTTKKLF